VRADPGQLEQVIVNLAVNARDAMEANEDGRCTLTLQTYSVTPEEVGRLGSDILPPGDYTALRVSDTGTGMPPAVLAKIFEPFFTTKEVGKGTGLGSSTVYGIVKQSGGFIFAESEEGAGTSFTIYLPVHRAEAVKPKSNGKPKEAAAELWGRARSCWSRMKRWSAPSPNARWSATVMSCSPPRMARPRSRSSPVWNMSI
jgi:two-component system cell cycle sensor histidine kinase/response regulator CckA